MRNTLGLSLMAIALGGVCTIDMDHMSIPAILIGYGIMFAIGFVGWKLYKPEEAVS